METVDVNLPYPVFAQIELSQHSKLLKMLNLNNLIVRSVENFQLF